MRVKPATTTVTRAETYDDLRKVIVERFPLLSNCLQQVANYSLENPSDMALETIAVVAPRAGVQPSSLIRFAKTFGFSGYSEMQRVFQMRLTDATPDYKERVRLLSDDRPGDGDEDVMSLLVQFVQADIVGLQCLLQQERIGELLDAAVNLMSTAETVYLVAHRRSFPVTCYLSYALSQLHVRNVLVDGVGGMFFQQVGQATPRDVILAVSMKSYSSEVVQAVREASQRGIKVIAITDSPLSPLTKHGTVTLEVRQPSVQMFRSISVPMTLAITLIVGLGRVLETKKGGRPQKPSAKA